MHIHVHTHAHANMHTQLPFEDLIHLPYLAGNCFQLLHLAERSCEMWAQTFAPFLGLPPVLR